MKNFCEEISKATEKTEITERHTKFGKFDASTPATSVGPCGWILYDGECRYCITAAKQFSQIFGRRGFVFLRLQTPWIQQRLNLTPGGPLTEMHVLTADGHDFGGADAVLFLMEQIWWLWPFSKIGELPGMHRVVDRAYRWVATHRSCSRLKCEPLRSNGEISSSLKRQIIPWVALIVLPALAWMVRSHVAPWVFMWVMAGAIFFGSKWLTVYRAITRIPNAPLPHLIAYVFLWVGMDADSFARPRGHRQPITRALPVIGLDTLKILFGFVLLFRVARRASNDLLAGWIGMAGMILILHFGTFDLLASLWTVAGVAVRPIMNAPLKSTHLTEFWGRRWNGAFNQLMLDTFFRRFAKSSGAVRATLVAFVISGLIHELVISLPAGAGYGLPAGVLQLFILIASAQVPQIFDWKTNLTGLPQFLRQLFWVYGAFIVLVIIGFSELTFFNASEMAAGAPVARSLCAFIAIFWALRLFVQFAIFNARPFLTNRFYKLGYHGLTLIFAALVAIYTLAAFVPVRAGHAAVAQVSRAQFGDSPNRLGLKQGILSESSAVSCRDPRRKSHVFPNQDYKK